VVFLHGCPSSRLDLRLSEQLAAVHGVRLISFDRPGYGRSSAAPFSLVTVSDDVAAIVDELGIETFAVFGQSAGSAYALALPALHAERVRRVGLASVAGPFDPGWLDRFDEDDQAIYALRDDPDAAAELAATFFKRPEEAPLRQPTTSWWRRSSRCSPQPTAPCFRIRPLGLAPP
jgi:pimeloyl-ACP methyl ester carboxylesterase